MTAPDTGALVDVEEVRRAAERLGGRIHRTPVLRSTGLGEL